MRKVSKSSAKSPQKLREWILETFAYRTDLWKVWKNLAKDQKLLWEIFAFFTNPQKVWKRSAKGLRITEVYVRVGVPIKVIIQKSRGGVSLVEQDTIENVS